MLENMRRERQIRQVLLKLARQRVTLVLQPGNIWVIERALMIDGDTDAHLKTCYMRGWVEQLEHAIPSGQLSPGGELPKGDLFTGTTPIYRLTDSGWSVINRSHQFTLFMVFLAFLTLIATVGA